MTKSSRKILYMGVGVAALLLSFLSPPGLMAQEYPNRAIRIIVPIGPGGGYDVFGRIVGDQLSRQSGQAVYVENKVGAGTIVGTQAAIASPPDGYTLVVGGLSNIVFNGNLYSKPPYDAQKSLIPVAIIFKNAYMLLTSPKLAYKTAPELIAAAKAKPNGLNLATAGKGTGQQLSAIAFMNATGTKLQEVPYKGASAVYPDLLAGRIDVFFDSDTSALPYVKSGHVRALAITSLKRSREAPDVPTLEEIGIPVPELSSWIGIFAPTGTPKPIILDLQKRIAASADELRSKFTQIGGEYINIDADKLEAFVASETQLWSKVIKDANIKMD